MRCSEKAICAMLASLFLTMGPGCGATQLSDATGQCLGDAQGSTPNSKLIKPTQCAQQPKSYLTWSALGEIRSSKWCLGVADANPSPTATVVWAGCIGTINLMWRYSSDNEIVSDMHGLCLTRMKNSSQPLARYQMLVCDGRSSQKWRVEHVRGAPPPSK
jgi:hypothetical protein